MRRAGTVAALVALPILAALIWWRWPDIRWHFHKQTPAAKAAIAAFRFPGVKQVTEIEEFGAVYIEIVTKDVTTDTAVFELALCQRIKDAGGTGILIRVNREADGQNVWTGVCR